MPSRAGHGSAASIRLQRQKLYFVPRHQNSVGVLDTITSVFTYIVMGGTGNYRYAFGTAVGTRVYFAPHYEANIGVVDTTTDTFSTIAVSVSGNDRFGGAVAVGSTGERRQPRMWVWRAMWGLNLDPAVSFTLH